MWVERHITRHEEDVKAGKNIKMVNYLMFVLLNQFGGTVRSQNNDSLDPGWDNAPRVFGASTAYLPKSIYPLVPQDPVPRHKIEKLPFVLFWTGRSSYGHNRQSVQTRGAKKCNKVDAKSPFLWKRKSHRYPLL
jgi:hypothetical protein